MTAVNGFAGIWPVDRDVFAESDFDVAAPTDIELPPWDEVGDAFVQGAAPPGIELPPWDEVGDAFVQGTAPPGIELPPWDEVNDAVVQGAEYVINTQA